MRIRDNSSVKSISQSSWSIAPFRPREESTSVFSLPQINRMTDEVTPGFSRRRSEGQVIVNPMTKLEVTSDAVDCPWWRSRTAGDGLYYNYDSAQAHIGANDHVISEPDVAGEIDRQVALSVTKAYAEVGKADVSVLEELVELRETLSFLYSPVKKMVEITKRTSRYLDRVKRFDEAYEKRLAKWKARLPKYRGPRPTKVGRPELNLGGITATDIPSAWLAYRYAIMPLIYTFQGVEKLLDRVDYPERMTARAKESEEIVLDRLLVWRTVNDSYGNIRYRFERVGRAKVSTRAGVLYVPDWSLQRRLGFQLHQVPAALYEGIPLSFVADWFYNGAEAYQAITAELRAQAILAAWVSIKVEYRYSYYLNAQALDAATDCHPGGRTMDVAGLWKERRRANLSDIRVMTTVNLNAKRITDGLALAFNMLATARKGAR